MRKSGDSSKPTSLLLRSWEKDGARGGWCDMNQTVSAVTLAQTLLMWLIKNSGIPHTLLCSREAKQQKTPGDTLDSYFYMGGKTRPPQILPMLNTDSLTTKQHTHTHTKVLGWCLDVSKMSTSHNRNCKAKCAIFVQSVLSLSVSLLPVFTLKFIPVSCAIQFSMCNYIIHILVHCYTACVFQLRVQLFSLIKGI